MICRMPFRGFCGSAPPPSDYRPLIINNLRQVCCKTTIKGMPPDRRSVPFFCLHTFGINHLKKSSTNFLTKEMQKATKLRVLALSLAMALGMLLPTTTLAQGNDNMLRFEDEYGGSRSGFASDWPLFNQSFGSGGYNLNNQTFGQAPAPLGSGLIIMLAAGGAYMLKKRKKRIN